MGCRLLVASRKGNWARPFDLEWLALERIWNDSRICLLKAKEGSGEKCEGELSVSTDRDVGAEMRKLTRKKYAIILKVYRGESMQVI